MGTREWDFTDCNLDKFLIYDWKLTQEFGGQPLPDYDYENQNHLRPRQRKRVFPTEKEFWNFDERVDFYVNCTEYAEFRKFKYWFYREVTPALLYPKKISPLPLYPLNFFVGQAG
jgi:hypothetical protein